MSTTAWLSPVSSTPASTTPAPATMLLMAATMLAVVNRPTSRGRSVASEASASPVLLSSGRPYAVK
jgi:hypothetical protein